MGNAWPAPSRTTNLGLEDFRRCGFRRVLAFSHLAHCDIVFFASRAPSPSCTRPASIRSGLHGLSAATARAADSGTNATLADCLKLDIHGHTRIRTLEHARHELGNPRTGRGYP